MPAPRIETPRLLLRHWCQEDREPFAQMNSDSEVMRYFPQTLDRVQSDLFAEVIQIGLEERDHGLWAVELRNDRSLEPAPFIGFVGLSVPTWNASFTPCTEIGWRLNRPFWGRGFATEAARHVLRYGFQVLKLNEVVSFTSLLNARSMAVMERLGMTRDITEDFDHPKVETNNELCRHALYRISDKKWANSN